MRSMPDADRVSITVADEAGLAPIASALVASLPPQACIAIHGDLGAGKTTFVKAIAAAAGIDPTDVVSPTFGLIHEHRSAGPGKPVHLVHADLYRLAGPEELRETGWDDATAARPDARTWTFVEWPERIASLLPADRLDLVIKIVSETGRTLAFTSRGAAHAPVIPALRRHDAA